MGNTVTSLTASANGGHGARARNFPKLLKALRRAKDERGVQLVARTLARSPTYLLRRDPKYSALSTTAWHEAAANPHVGGQLIAVLEGNLRAWVPTLTAKQIKKLDSKLKTLRGKAPTAYGVAATPAFQRASAPASAATSPIAAAAAPATSLTAEAETQEAEEPAAEAGANGAVLANGAHDVSGANGEQPRHRSRSATGVRTPRNGTVGANGAETGTDGAEDDDDEDDEEDEEDGEEEEEGEDEDEEEALLGNDTGAPAPDQSRPATAAANGGAAATAATAAAGGLLLAAPAAPLSAAQEALVRQVLDAALDARNELGQTPLMAAASEGATAAVKALLQLGSDPLAVDNRGARTAVHLAARDGKAEALELLLVAAAEQYPLIRATDIGTVTSLTPLHYACYGGWVDVAEVLLRHGAALMPVSTGTQYDTSPDDPGTTPLHVCAWRGDVVMCRQLLAAHLERSLMRDPRRSAVDPRSARTCHGHTPLLMLHRKEYDKPIQTLLNPTKDLVALMPEVVAAAAAAAMRAGGATGLSCVVPPLQFLAAAVLSSQMLVSISAATTAAARAAGKAGGAAAAGANGKAGGADAPKATTADAAMSSIFNPDAASTPSSGPSVSGAGGAGGVAAGGAPAPEMPAGAAASAAAAAAAKKVKVAAPRERGVTAAEARVRALTRQEEEEEAAALAVLAAAEAAAAAAAMEVDARSTTTGAGAAAAAGDALDVARTSVASTAVSAATAATAATGVTAAARPGGGAANPAVDGNANAAASAMEDAVQIHVVAHSARGVTLSSVPAGTGPNGPTLFGRGTSSLAGSSPVAGASPLSGASPIHGSSPRASGAFEGPEARVSGAGNGDFLRVSSAAAGIEGSLLPPPALGGPSVGISLGSVSVGLAPGGAAGGGAAGGAGAGGNTCSVCMDAAVMVRSTGCGHPLCAGCAQKLAATVLRRVRPLACPFCRQVVPNFEAIAPPGKK